MTTENYFKALEATKKLHEGEKLFSGRFLTRYLDDIRQLIVRYDVKTLLDYGCGRAVAWEDGTLARELGVKVTLYDPGVPRFAADPVGTFDMVICTQALGSVPIDALSWVIDRLDSFAIRVVYIGERLGPVRKRVHYDLANRGVMPHGWTRGRWKEEISRISRGCDVYLRTTDKRDKSSVLEQVA